MYFVASTIAICTKGTVAVPVTSTAHGKARLAFFTPQPIRRSVNIKVPSVSGNDSQDDRGLKFSRYGSVLREEPVAQRENATAT